MYHENLIYGLLGLLIMLESTIIDMPYEVIYNMCIYLPILEAKYEICEETFDHLKQAIGRK